MLRLVPIVVALMLISSVAASQPDKTEATKLFEQGRQLVEQGKLAEACALFEKSYAIDPQPGTALNLGDCAEKTGKLREAWLLFDTAARDFDKAGKLVQGKFARDRAEAVAPKLAIVIVRLADPQLPGLVVKIGGREMPLGVEIVERLDAGPVEVTVTAPGKQPFSTTATGIVGRHTIVDVPALGADGTGSGGGVVVTGPTDGRGGRKKSRIILAAGVAGAGVVAFAVSGIVGLSAKSSYESAFGDDGTCSDSTGRVVCSDPADAAKVRDAGSKADIATGFAIAGGVFVAAGVVLFFTAPRESVTIAPMAGASSGGISISGTF